MAYPTIHKAKENGTAKEVALEAKDIAIKEGREREDAIIRKYVEHDRKKEIIEETEAFEEDLHETPSSSLPPSAVSPSASVSSTPKSEFLLQIENVLAGGLGDIYGRMEPTLKERFKMKGEEVARKIEQVIAHGKYRIQQILTWIKEWLKMIPAVNRFFLEQEAKIKTDKILSMVKE